MDCSIQLTHAMPTYCNDQINSTNQLMLITYFSTVVKFKQFYNFISIEI